MITKTEVKYIQSLAHKKFREEENTLVAEGVKMVDELLSDFPDQVKKYMLRLNGSSMDVKYQKVFLVLKWNSMSWIN